MHRPRLIVDEEYELVFDDSRKAIELDTATFEPNRLWVSAKVQREFTEYHGCDADEAISNIRLLVCKALEEGRYARGAWGGHNFWWRGFSATVDPGLDVAIRYRTNHYERTPRQVADGVKSRLSKKGRLRGLERIFPDEIEVGDIIDGIVSTVVKFGVFVRITDQFDALMHISVLGDDPESVALDFIPGESVQVEVVHVDHEAGRVNVRPAPPHGV